MRKADDVRRALERHARVDVTNTIRMFKETTGSDDAGLLVRFMVDKGMLTADAASKVEAVEVDAATIAG